MACLEATDLNGFDSAGRPLPHASVMAWFSRHRGADGSKPVSGPRIPSCARVRVQPPSTVLADLNHEVVWAALSVPICSYIRLGVALHVPRARSVICTADFLAQSFIT